MDQEQRDIILQLLNARCWNVYADMPESFEQTIQQGPATTLGLRTRYVIFPCATNPSDPCELEQRVRSFASTKGLPTITIDAQPLALIHFTLDDAVCIDTRRISYSLFISALKQLPYAEPNNL